MIWLTILVALSIPLAAVILDSPVVRGWADRHREGHPGAPDAGSAKEFKQLGEKVEMLETELDVVTRELAQLKEGQQFLQRLLEDPAARKDAARLPKQPG